MYKAFLPALFLETPQKCVYAAEKSCSAQIKEEEVEQTTTTAPLRVSPTIFITDLNGPPPPRHRCALYDLALFCEIRRNNDQNKLSTNSTTIHAKTKQIHVQGLHCDAYKCKFFNSTIRTWNIIPNQATKRQVGPCAYSDVLKLKIEEVVVSHSCPFCDICHPLRSWPSSAYLVVPSPFDHQSMSFFFSFLLELCKAVRLPFLGLLIFISFLSSIFSTSDYSSDMPTYLKRLNFFPDFGWLFVHVSQQFKSVDNT